MSMFNSFLNIFFSLLFQLILLGLIYAVLRLLFRQEFGWKLFYWGLSLLLTFVVGVTGVSSVLSCFLRGFMGQEDRFIIRDGNSFVVLLMELTLFYSSLLTIPILVIFIYSYITSSLTKIEATRVRHLFYSFIYFYPLILWIVDQDLAISTWDSVLATGVFPIALQLQPDLEFLFLSYKGEWLDFSFFVLIEAFLFFMFYEGYLLKLWRHKGFHFVFLVTHIICLFYFFGGEGFLYDSCVLLLGAFLFELLYYQLRFFYFLKRFQSN